MQQEDHYRWCVTPPYDRVKEIYPEARTAGQRLIAEGKQDGGKRKTFIYVNNRLEGNALETIDAMVEEVSLSY